MTVEEIKRDIQKKMQNAMNKTHQEGKQVIDESFDVFYSQGNPRIYNRTGTLKGAAYTPSPTVSSNSAHMEIGYEGDQIGYQTGTFTGGEVLGAPMTGTYGVLGNPNYDEETFEEIFDIADKNFASEFK